MMVQEPISQVPAGPRKRILFAPMPMYGHVSPMMRLAKYFTQHTGHEVHVWSGGSFVELVPKGAIVHSDGVMANADATAKSYEEGFCQAAIAAPDWHSSIAFMLEMLAQKPAEENHWLQSMLQLVDLMKKVKPDILVADMGYEMEDLVAGYCAREGTKYYVLVCPARPEAILRPGVMLPILFKHASTLFKAIPKLMKLTKLVEEATGPKATKPEDLGIRLFPGERSLLQDEPGKREYCVGPFLPVPLERKSQEAIRRVNPELAAWMDSSDAPIVYVGFGTLVKPNKDLVQRLAEGLACGQLSGGLGGPRSSRGGRLSSKVSAGMGCWRVLWSLPKDCQMDVPVDDHPGARAAHFRVEQFLPQQEILRHDKVRCFVSHCGQNSTHEGLICGVPFACMPFYCDQFEWADAICNTHQAGIMLDKAQSTADDIAEAIRVIVADGSSYQVQAAGCAEQVLSARMRIDGELGSLVGETECPGVALSAALIQGKVSLKQVQTMQRPLSKASAWLSRCAPY